MQTYIFSRSPIVSSASVGRRVKENAEDPQNKDLRSPSLSELWKCKVVVLHRWSLQQLLIKLSNKKTLPFMVRKNS